MIKSFKCSTTEAFFSGKRISRFVAFESTAMRKLQQLHAAPNLDFLRKPPGNRLEPLLGDRSGQYSIRINNQWRLCFVWHEGHAWQVEILDYH